MNPILIVLIILGIFGLLIAVTKLLTKNKRSSGGRNFWDAVKDACCRRKR